MLQESIISLAASITGSYIPLYIIAKNKKIFPILKETFWNVLFYGFIIWKFSYAFLHPISALKNPITILYFNGGFWGIVIAFIVGTIIVYRTKKKHALPADFLIHATFISALGFHAVYKLLHAWILSFSVVLIIQGLISVFLLFFIRNKKPLKKLTIKILYFLLAQFALTLFIPAPFMLGLSKEQLLYITAALAVLYIDKKEGDIK